MSNYAEITAAQTDKNSPVNEALMQGDEGTQTGGLRHNFINHEDRIAALEGAGGGGGGGSVIENPAFGQITLGGDTDEAHYWKKRFSTVQNLLFSEDEKYVEGFDPESNLLHNELVQFLQTNDSGVVALTTDSRTYLDVYLSIAKDSAQSFKIKKGINFFGLSFSTFGSASDNVEILVNGQTPSSLGLTDEEGNPAPDAINTLTGTQYFQDTFFFYGLDGEEAVVEILNNDSASRICVFDAVEVGYRTPNVSIDETLKLKSGKANVRGTEVTFTEQELSFGKLDKNGHTAAIVADTGGAVSVVDGEPPAMTQGKPEENVAFSGTVTQLKVKNNFYFPTSGICLASLPNGNHHFFSYSGKTDTNPQSHSFDDVNWQSKPNQDFEPCKGFDVATIGNANGDLNINYWGTAPIVVTSANNKLDFAVTIAGSTTNHSITIPNGNYSSDLVPIGKVIRELMRVAKPINGEYHVDYDETTQLWVLWVDSEEVEDFQLPFSSGANQANSIHPTLGFADSDLDGNLTYLGATAVQHKCVRALEADRNFMYANDPRIKYYATDAGLTYDHIEDVKQRLGFGYVRTFATAPGGHLFQVFPDNDCCGLTLSFVGDDEGAMISVQIDDGEIIYLIQTDDSHNVTTPRGKIKTGFISFPRGSRKITVRQEVQANFKINSNPVNEVMAFVGCRQWFSKEPWEGLPLDRSIIKTIEVSPLSLYATVYGHNGGALYSPAGSNDQINTISEVGSWSGSGATDFFNSGLRQTATINDYVEVDFTLVGDGGGIFMKTQFTNSRSLKVGLFISTSAINESTDRVKNTMLAWAGPASYYDQDGIGIKGLKAGTYKARFKNEHGATFINGGIGIIDTVHPEENKNTCIDLSNPGQGIAYPINVIKNLAQQDAVDRVPAWLERSGYREGITSHLNYSVDSPTYTNLQETTNITLNADLYYGHNTEDQVIGNQYKISAFMKSFVFSPSCFQNRETASVGNIDGIALLSSINHRVQVKNGSSPNSVRGSIGKVAQKEFKLSCSHNSGLVFDIADTRGIQNDRTVLLYDSVLMQYERAVISSFVVGTSFTIKKALTNINAADVTEVIFFGFHSFNINATSTAFFILNTIDFEPLTLNHSNSIKRKSHELVEETKSIIHREIANGDDLFYPIHSDGVAGNWNTTKIQIIGSSSGSSYKIDEDLKNITVGGGTIDLKLTSTRLVPKRS